MSRLETKEENKWTDWDNIKNASNNARAYYGVYKIGLIDASRNPIPVKRIHGEDKEGIIYIGRARPYLSLATRINQFNKIIKHSGAGTYFLLMLCLAQYEDTSSYDLQYTVYRMCSTETISKNNDLEREKNMIIEKERNVLAEYFQKYCELPPCNSNFGNKWEYFSERIKMMVKDKNKSR